MHAAITSSRGAAAPLVLVSAAAQLTRSWALQELLLGEGEERDHDEKEDVALVASRLPCAFSLERLSACCTISMVHTACAWAATGDGDRFRLSSKLDSRGGELENGRARGLAPQLLLRRSRSRSRSSSCRLQRRLPAANDRRCATAGGET